jgi:outer membrane protein OmpA-like peptidoglycan-associated protein
MKDNPDIKLIEVQGHTDNKGRPWYNKALSARRAKAVMDGLIKRGVDKTRLRSEGYGQAKPIADNKTDEGRSVNRRVEFQIIKREKKAKTN